MKSKLKLDPALQILLDTQPPFTMSVEPVNRPVFEYGYHLGHDADVARRFVQNYFRDYDHTFGHGLYTIAIKRNGKVWDVYDGCDWSSEVQDRLFDERNNNSAHDREAPPWAKAPGGEHQ